MRSGALRIKRSNINFQTLRASAVLFRDATGMFRSIGTLHGSLLKHEKEMIEAALAATQRRISGPSGAATKLGLPSRTLDSKIKRLRINVYRFKTPL